jgi:hypothetical protein
MQACDDPSYDAQAYTSRMNSHAPCEARLPLRGGTALQCERGKLTIWVVPCPKHSDRPVRITHRLNRRVEPREMVDLRQRPQRAEPALSVPTQCRREQWAGWGTCVAMRPRYAAVQCLDTSYVGVQYLMRCDALAARRVPCCPPSLPSRLRASRCRRAQSCSGHTPAVIEL